MVNPKDSKFVLTELVVLRTKLIHMLCQEEADQVQELIIRQQVVHNEAVRLWELSMGGPA